jgi:hypothetical protein
MKTYIKLLIFLCSINLIAQNNTIFVQPITATKPYQGVFGSATLQIDDAGSDGLITNPLIIAEGLDTGLMAQAGRIGDTDITTFIRNVNDPNSLNLEELLTGGTDLIFGDQNYDIIYVNWNNGTDFIQRNAYVLEAVIAWVNANKTGSNKNVVLGQSMGGLIARYALRDMENTGLNHDTSLYISHDAPHQGAHIPLGMLYMARDVVNEFIQTPLGNISVPVEGVGNVGLATIDDLLDAPAINQMLINSVDTNGNRTNTVHSNWQTELRNFGYPLQTRNIALSNASHCASSQGLVSNQELVTVTGNGGTSVLTSILMYIYLPIDPIIGIALYDVSAALLGFLPGNSSLDLEFRANAFPLTGTARIYKGRLTYKKTFLWLLPITRTIFNNSENSLNGDKFIDNYPGGVTPNFFAISEESSDSNWFYNYDYNLNVNLNFNFIPATSALDVGSGNVTLSDSDYFVKYTLTNPPTGSRTIPFVNFTTSYNISSINEPHISFNTRNGNWLASELDDIPNNQQVFNCSFVCENIEINGVERFCSGARSYGLPSGGSAYQWQIIEGNAATITAGATTRIVTITKTNFNGWITLRGTVFSTQCGGSETNPIQVSTTKRIYIGVPTLNFLENVNSTETGLPQPIAPVNSCSVIGIKLNLWPSNPEVLEVQWEKVTTNYQWSHTTTEYVLISPVCNEPITFRVRFRNSCGWSTWQNITYNVTECSGSCSNPQGNITSTNFIIFPVPADTSLTVQLKNQPVGLLVAGDTLNIKLYNISGLMVRNVNAIATQTVIDVSNLNMGTYTLVITYNGVVETHNVAIN